MVKKFVGMRVQGLVDEGDIAGLDEAVDVMSKHGSPTSSGFFDTYRDVVVGVLGRSKKQEGDCDMKKVVGKLRKVMYEVASVLRAEGKMEDEFENLLMATHYTHMMNECLKFGLDELALKCSITLLRYSGVVPVDKAFYVVGMLAKKNKNVNLAFVMLNRFVDLIEAIEEGDMGGMDNADFAEATNVPFDVTLPASFYLDDGEDREEVRDYVLSVCMDNDVEQKLPRQGEAEGTVYGGLFASDKPTCIVTGYAVNNRDLIEVNKSKANKRDWNALGTRSKKCPWSEVDASPSW